MRKQVTKKACRRRRVKKQSAKHDELSLARWLKSTADITRRVICYTGASKRGKEHWVGMCEHNQGFAGLVGQRSDGVRDSHSSDICCLLSERIAYILENLDRCTVSYTL